VAALITEVEKGPGNKRYGLQDDEPRSSKRARVDEDED
jgi:hypothetical protein